MKKSMIKMAVTGMMAGLMAASAWAGNANVNGSCGQAAGTAACAMTLPAGDMSESERATLLHMREEEKLARDVYTTLNETWNHWAFENIARSEQLHMEATLALMEKYAVADPVSDDATGVFADAEMKTLYDQMVEGGSAALADALRVGAAIEELDIADLKNALDGTDDADIRIVYQNLMKGSRNHLRTFVYQLAVQGEVYQPQHLSAEEFQAIVTSPRERGFVDEDGNAATQGQGRRSGRKAGSGDCPFVAPDTAAPDAADDLSTLTPADDTLLAGRGKGKGHGPGDGTGNGGNGPKDGTGNGSKTGTCVNTDMINAPADLIVARGGNGNGGHGPGDGTGNGGSGPKDGTGNGSKTGTCVNS